jgi:RsiW-degrading membrane proteinase PrsW (M82 family)
MEPTALGAVASIGQLFFALLAGIAPALLWLWFWGQEDSKRPEPRGLVIWAFLAGMAAVILVLPFQHYAIAVVKDQNALILAWAIVEELMKLAVGLIVVLRNRAVDEPLDPIEYMITIALGFSALENTLFLVNPFGSGALLAQPSYTYSPLRPSAELSHCHSLSLFHRKLSTARSVLSSLFSCTHSLIFLYLRVRLTASSTSS